MFGTYYALTTKPITMSPLTRLFHALLLGIPLAAAQTSCDYIQLRTLADYYASSQASGEVADDYLSPGMNYTQNGISMPITNSILTDPLDANFHHVLTDGPGCAAFVDMVVASAGAKDWFLTNTQIFFVHDPEINYLRPVSVETVFSSLTDVGAARRMEAFEGEDWGGISGSDQMSREALKAVADAYLDDRAEDIAWTTPCARLLGGDYVSGDDGQCYGPRGEGRVTFSNKKYVIDVGTGAVSVMSRGSNGVTASHEFRIEAGKLRYTHAVRRL